jgi:hypothetical protein
MASWNFKRNGQITGPMSEQEIRSFLLKHELLAGDEV